MTAFHGNFFLRSMDLLALPNVTPDHCYGVEYTIDEEITTPLACFQTAVLHTSCHGKDLSLISMLRVNLCMKMVETNAYTYCIIQASVVFV
jgi:protein transport protein SEC24